MPFLCFWGQPWVLVSCPYLTLFKNIQSKVCVTVFTFKASFMLVFNYVSGLISCYFLIETCILTNLESFQELIFFFGGGRAGILFITLMQIVVYSLMPIVFMCKVISADKCYR